jgi:hypothetical protein
MQALVLSGRRPTLPPELPEPAERLGRAPPTMTNRRPSRARTQIKRRGGAHLHRQIRRIRQGRRLKSHQTGDKHQQRDRPMRLHRQAQWVGQPISGAPKQHPQAYQSNETQQQQRQPEDCFAAPCRDGARSRETIQASHAISIQKQAAAVRLSPIRYEIRSDAG